MASSDILVLYQRFILRSFSKPYTLTKTLLSTTTAMASSLILLRRSLRSLSGLHHSFSATATSLSLPISGSISSHFSLSKSPNVVDGFQSRSFRSTSISLLSSRYGESSELSPEIGPDTILFEGCDFNHWLFVCDFPRDNKPPPEEMIRFYEETCAKGLNIRFWFFIIINSKFNLESLRLLKICLILVWKRRRRRFMLAVQPLTLDFKLL